MNEDTCPFNLPVEVVAATADQFRIDDNAGLFVALCFSESDAEYIAALINAADTAK